MTFLPVSDVQHFIDLFTILTIFYKFALILFISFSYEPSRQYGTSPFSKTILKNRNDCKRGIGQIRISLIELSIEIAYCIAYCIKTEGEEKELRLK